MYNPFSEPLTITTTPTSSISTSSSTSFLLYDTGTGPFIQPLLQHQLIPLVHNQSVTAASTDADTDTDTATATALATQRSTYTTTSHARHPRTCHIKHSLNESIPTPLDIEATATDVTRDDEKDEDDEDDYDEDDDKPLIHLTDGFITPPSGHGVGSVNRNGVEILRGGARTKQTARKPKGGKKPRASLATKAARGVDPVSLPLAACNVCHSNVLKLC